MRDMIGIQPGTILRNKFLIPLEITAYRLSKETYLPQTRISMILKGERAITAITALRFSKFFGTSARFWLNLQADYDIELGSRKDEYLIRIEQYNFKK